jgi:uncharacterized protein (UPF0261 family)
MSSYAVIGTWDVTPAHPSKGEELEFICQEIRRRGHVPVKLDVSTRGAWKTRDLAVADAIDGATARLLTIMASEEISGVVAIGGGTGLFIGARIMEKVPLLVPKVEKQLMKGMREECIIDVDLCLNDPRFGLVASQYLHGLVEAKWRT